VSARQPDADDRGYSFEVEHAIGQLLLVGGVASVTLVLLGLGIYAGTEGLRAPIDIEPLVNPDGGTLPPHIFVSVSQIFRSLLPFLADPLALVALGLVVLLSTPVLVVALATLVFFRQRDRKYSLIATIVLAMLLLSFFLAGGGA
jgi:uncharacterized membrane protein